MLGGIYRSAFPFQPERTIHRRQHAACVSHRQQCTPAASKDQGSCAGLDRRGNAGSSTFPMFKTRLLFATRKRGGRIGKTGPQAKKLRAKARSTEATRGPTRLAYEGLSPRSPLPRTSFSFVVGHCTCGVHPVPPELARVNARRGRMGPAGPAAPLSLPGPPGTILQPHADESTVLSWNQNTTKLISRSKRATEPLGRSGRGEQALSVALAAVCCAGQQSVVFWRARSRCWRGNGTSEHVLPVHSCHLVRQVVGRAPL